MVLPTHRQLADCTPLPPSPPLSVCVLSFNTIFIPVTLHGTSNATMFNATMSHGPQHNAHVTRCSSSVFIGRAAYDGSVLFAYQNYGDSDYGDAVSMCQLSKGLIQKNTKHREAIHHFIRYKYDSLSI